ncbi:unnamed protein product [Ilex paraguariensis]|uniref:HTH myb-type domain-containing protein n=1 Tax=Ilex paraguariensis TaxID=185542 RepID=A0ABC8R6H0_9AQUA
MVLQKRLHYGFDGYQVPPTPRATRSARRRRSFRKTVDNQMCAFDLLATVAGKLLLEGEISPSSTDTLINKDQYAVANDSVKKEQQDEDKPFKGKPCDPGTWDRSFFVSDIVSQAPVVNHSLKEFLHTQNDTCSGLASVITTSDSSEKAGSAEKFVNGESKIELGSFASKVDVDSSGYRVSSGCILGNESRKQVKIDLPNNGKASVSTRTMCYLEDPVVWDGKSPALVSSDNIVKLLSCRDHIPCRSLPICRGDVKLGIKDDDENSSGCTQPSTTNKAFRPLPRIGDRRIRKLLASKYWKVNPKLKNGECFNAGAAMRPVYRSKVGYKRQRSQRDYPFKKRKFYYCSSVSNDGGSNNDSISSSPGKGSNGDASGLGAILHGATGTSAYAAGQHVSFQSRDSHVKLKIKSFRVPELFVEIPETATVGSLKRTVMEAVTAILGGGLCVGVLHQGKKIRDDNKTLLQTGISHDNNLDALGFTLEPNPSHAPQSLCQEDRPSLFPWDTPQPIKSYLPVPNEVHDAVQLGTSDTSPDYRITNFGNFIDSDHDSAPSPPDMSIDKGTTDSRALVAIPAMNVDALAVVPMRKSKRSEAVQRRIRRPFSVSEVEALVHAVEKLGTGRWRDVKIRAFDNAKHRTYVDLKVKK